jgi:hypothetical protein
MEIVVTRPKQYQDKIRDYRLLVDGVNLVSIKPNSETVVNLPEGAEYIQAKIDWCSSQKFRVCNIKANQITIKNTFGSNFLMAVFMPLYYITFGKGKYLTIESSI